MEDEKKDMEVCDLAVTVHDPDGRFIRRLHPALSFLSKLYDGKSAACTNSTDKSVVNALHASGFSITMVNTGGVGNARRDAIRLVLHIGSAARVQYADFDRLLHWVYTFPDELQQIVSYQLGRDYLALCRSIRAWNTHPKVQILAESLTNSAFAALVGLDVAEVDMVAGSFVLSRRAAELIVRVSQEASNASDLEWPGIVMRAFDTMPQFRTVEGLEFETADYYDDDIMAIGSVELWKEWAYSQPDVWIDRTRLALDSICALQRVINMEFPSG